MHFSKSYETYRIGSVAIRKNFSLDESNKYLKFYIPVKSQKQKRPKESGKVYFGYYWCG